jgi:hypothetical protein
VSLQPGGANICPLRCLPDSNILVLCSLSSPGSVMLLSCCSCHASCMHACLLVRRAHPTRPGGPQPRAAGVGAGATLQQLQVGPVISSGRSVLVKGSQQLQVGLQSSPVAYLWGQDQSMAQQEGRSRDAAPVTSPAQHTACGLASLPYCMVTSNKPQWHLDTVGDPSGQRVECGPGR